MRSASLIGSETLRLNGNIKAMARALYDVNFVDMNMAKYFMQMLGLL